MSAFRSFWLRLRQAPDVIRNRRSLARAKRVYPTLHCHKAHTVSKGEPAPAYCAGRLTRNRYIWFGNGPIRVIALSPTSMG
jgi:hypothetical protein